MPSTLTRFLKIHKKASHETTQPPLGWVGTVAATPGYDFVYLNAGVVTPAASLGAAIGANKAIGILGDSATMPITSSTAAGTLVYVDKLDPTTIVTMPLYNSNTAAAVTLANAKAAVGLTYDLYRSSAGVWYVDYFTTTNPKVEIIGIDPGTINDTVQNVQVRFLETAVIR